MFKNIKGQKHATNLLETLIKGNRFPHALLFYGNKGVGKFTVAKEIVKFFNCQNPDIQNKGKDNCNICNRIEKEQYPDFFIVRREITEDKNKKTKQAKELKIEQIKKLIQQTNLMPFESKYKFYIIEDAETLNIESSNALLKTLEEPRPNNYIILITNNINKIIDTIYSRCVKIKFNDLPADILKELIIKKYDIDSELAGKIALISNGSMSKAKLLLSENNYESIFELFNSTIKLLTAKLLNVEQIETLTKELTALGQDYLEIILELLLIYFNEVYLATVYEIQRETFFKKVLKLKNQNINFKQYNMMLTHIMKSRYELTDTNINVNLLLKNLFITIKETIDGSI